MKKKEFRPDEQVMGISVRLAAALVRYADKKVIKCNLNYGDTLMDLISASLKF